MSELLNSMIERVYVQDNESYPDDCSLDAKSVFLSVLTNLMGDQYEVGNIQWADELKEKVTRYKERLKKERAAYRSHPDNKVSQIKSDSSMFTLSDLDRYDDEEMRGR